MIHHLYTRVRASALAWPVLALMLIVLAGCAGSTGTSPSPVGQIERTPSPSAGQLDGLAFPKGVSADFAWTDYPPKQDGAGFAAELGNHNIEAQEKSAAFVPALTPSGDALADSAYCIYRLRCYRQADTAALQFAWDGTPPAAGTCWIGLPNWEAQVWNWVPLPEDNEIAADPLELSTEDHTTVVAVVLTGQDAATLQSVSCVCDPDGTEPFLLYAPMWWPETYLMNMDGDVVREWPADYRVNSSVYLLDNGDLLRTNANGFGAAHGKFERLSWDGDLLWTWEDYPADFVPHHDIAPLPNGNVIILGDQLVSREEAIAAGRIEAFVPDDGLRMPMLLEVQPTGPTTGDIVWEWRLMDHLVQNVDSLKGNFGPVDGNSRMLDINYSLNSVVDYLHANAVDYNADLDQVMISMHASSELVVIDHSTTTEEAAGHTGGRLGYGGDFIYRWGNPAIYGGGTPEQQRLFFQHDTEWIADGLPGAGHILIFNNDCSEIEGTHYSSILEIVPPLNEDGSYELTDLNYGPDEPIWKYVADPPESFYASYISSSQRLRGGNTLICAGPQGYFFEITREGEKIWDYTNTQPPVNNQVFRVDCYYLFTPWMGLEQ